MLAYGGYMWMYGLDPTYILVLIGLVLSIAASAKVKSTFHRYDQVSSYRGLTGAQAAEQILHSQGIYDVQVTTISGELTDHYDPRSKTLRLSDAVYGKSSISAIGVAAHECGHAIQDDRGYAPLAIRGALVPIANFGTGISWFVILAGVFLSFNQTLINVGILLFSLGLLFQLVTLPVEFNASRRALALLNSSHILYEDEVKKARKVLAAAALTYVAAAAASALQLLRLVLLFGGRRRD